MGSAGRDRYLFTNATIVAAARIIEGGTVVVEDGTIVEVAARGYGAGEGVVDLGGRFLLPGLVDLHNDALEQEISPRPGGSFDPTFALLHLDRKLAAAGVTTEFHAVYFGERDGGRSITVANTFTRAVAELRTSEFATIDHQILYRFDVRTPAALDPLLDALDDAPIPYVSFNDHMPGQGQFNDLAAYRAYIRTLFPAGTDDETVDRAMEERLAGYAEREAEALAAMHRLADEGQRRRLILSSHDDDTPERVDLMHSLGCTIAEFPITVAAARRASELGMVIAMGAPNAVRGSSLTGNASALDLLSRGLVDVLIADYHASSMLQAVFRIVELGMLDLPTALRLVTETPARAVGMADRGTIAPGQRADLLVVERHGRLPIVAATIVRGAIGYLGGPFAAGMVGLRGNRD
ncbi:MAG: alpha-D-ribose 1-methylphosphonate 5-triphosphate diphosphatase [Chloroflexia bacterium]